MCLHTSIHEALGFRARIVISRVNASVTVTSPTFSYHFSVGAMDVDADETRGKVKELLEFYFGDSNLLKDR